jgi:hypothetical protein
MISMRSNIREWTYVLLAMGNYGVNGGNSSLATRGTLPRVSRGKLGVYCDCLLGFLRAHPLYKEVILRQSIGLNYRNAEY